MDPLNQLLTLAEDFTKQKEEINKNGVEGSSGKIIPTIARNKKRNPDNKKRTFISI